MATPINGDVQALRFKEKVLTGTTIAALVVTIALAAIAITALVRCNQILKQIHVLDQGNSCWVDTGALYDMASFWRGIARGAGSWAALTLVGSAISGGYLVKAHGQRLRAEDQALPARS